MANQNQYIDITTIDDFNQFLILKIAILWFHVNWSGTSLFTQKRFLEFQPPQIPVYKIDCSEQNLTYVEEWLSTQSKVNFNAMDLYTEGNGELALIKSGAIDDYILRPNMLSVAALEMKLKNWDQLLI
jgi:hypothetical protein